MYFAIGFFELFHPNSTSLKEKRMTVQSITNRMRKRFNVSASEVTHHNLWQRSGIGFSAVASTYSDLEYIVEAMRDTLYNHNDDFEILVFESRIIGWNDMN